MTRTIRAHFVIYRSVRAFTRSHVEQMFKKKKKKSVFHLNINNKKKKQ